MFTPLKSLFQRKTSNVVNSTPSNVVNDIYDVNNTDADDIVEIPAIQMKILKICISEKDKSTPLMPDNVKGIFNDIMGKIDKAPKLEHNSRISPMTPYVIINMNRFIEDKCIIYCKEYIYSIYSQNSRNYNFKEKINIAMPETYIIKNTYDGVRLINEIRILLAENSEITTTETEVNQIATGGKRIRKKSRKNRKRTNKRKYGKKRTLRK
jgi:hypothetical protein